MQSGRRSDPAAAFYSLVDASRACLISILKGSMRRNRLYIPWLVASAMLVPMTSGVAAPRGHCSEPVSKDFRTAAPDSHLAQSLVQLSENLDAGTYDISSLLVLRDCRLVFERYGRRIERDYNHSLYSVTKSVASTLVGALLYSGQLPHIDVSVASMLEKPPRLRDAAWESNGRITLRNVMQMASGLEYSHDPAGHPIYKLNSDRLEIALSAIPIAEPGAKYYYSDGDVSVTGAIIAAASGKDLYATAREFLLDPLEMSNHDWWFKDAAGRYPGGWGLRLRPMDMAKLGQLYLQGCSWNNRTICESSYVKAAWTPGVARFYGLHWWIGRTETGIDYYYASGFKGQRIFAVPAYGIVGVMTATLPNAEARAVDGLLIEALTAFGPGRNQEPDSAALERLNELQKAGFRGKSRAQHIEKQDYPQPPR